MKRDITVTARELRRHERRYRKLLDAGHELIVRRRGRSYLVQRLERVKVETQALEAARLIIDPEGRLSDRQLVDEVLRRQVRVARNGVISA